LQLPADPYTLKLIEILFLREFLMAQRTADEENRPEGRRTDRSNAFPAPVYGATGSKPSARRAGKS